MKRGEILKKTLGKVCIGLIRRLTNMMHKGEKNE
jgi:hypothetical protein